MDDYGNGGGETGNVVYTLWIEESIWTTLSTLHGG